jgi:DNA recombination protein RmuC
MPDMPSTSFSIPLILFIVSVFAVIGCLLTCERMRREKLALQTKVEGLAADLTSARIDVATERTKCESLRASEVDVEARLQRVAQHYVDDARELLLKAASERFNGDAAAFRERIAASVSPLDERLTQLGKSLSDLGTERTKDQERVATLLEALNGKMSGIDDATRRVERVFGNSQARGSWGEFELQRLLEMTGMTEHVSFDVQKNGYGADGAGRPDVVLKIPGNLNVPIDAKCPFSAYQEAASVANDAEREPLLNAAIAAVRSHVRALEGRRYHAAAGCVGWTIMFVPIEAMLSTLFARDPNLFEAARKARILIASPLTLLLYLEAFSRGWAAQKQSENAEVILLEARKLVERLAVFTDKHATLGKRLEGALDAYNDSVASYESRIGPQARRIVELRGDPVEGVPLEERRTNVRHLDVTRLPAPSLLDSQLGTGGRDREAG